MRAITLWQPWASLVAIGAKPYETRAYPPPRSYIGTRIAIHAAVRKVKLAEQQVLYSMTMGWTSDPARRDAALRLLGEDLPYGAVVCTAVLATAYQIADHGERYGKRVALLGCGRVGPIAKGYIPIDPFGDYSPGRWAWLLTDVQRLPEPIPAKGKQGYWEWTPPAMEIAHA